MPAASVQVKRVCVSEADQIKRHLLPLPHEISIERKVVLAPGDIGIRSSTTTDGTARDVTGRLRELFNDRADVDATGDRFEILVGVLDRDDALDGIKLDNARRLRAVPNHEQAYLIQPASGNRLIVAGLSDRGVLYGVATLCQLMAADFNSKSVSIPLASVLDWPDFDDRGFWHMPLKEIPWLASLKFNQFHCAIYFSVAPDRKAEPQMATGIADAPATGAQLSAAFTAARAHGAEVAPGIIHMDFWERCCAGFASTYPETVGKGEAAKGGYFETKGYRVPCASNPQLTKTLTELMTALASRGASDIYVWVSEYPGGQCECEPCMTEGQFQAETSAAIAAWRQVRETHPDLKLRLFFGAGGFTPGEKWFPDYPRQAVNAILENLPKEVRMCVSLGIKEQMLEDFVAHGGLVTRCFIVSLLFWDRFCCQHIQNRMRRLHATKMHGVSQYFDGSFEDVHGSLDLQISALAEYSWNANGRSIAEFGASWATHRGDKHPQAFGEWLSLMSTMVAQTSSMEQFIWSGSWLGELSDALTGRKTDPVRADAGPIDHTIEACRTALEYSKYFEAKRLPLHTEVAARTVAFQAANSIDDSIRNGRKALDLAARFEWTEPLSQTALLLRYCELEKAGLDLMDRCREGGRELIPRTAFGRFSEALQEFIDALHAQSNTLNVSPGRNDELRKDRIANLESRYRDILASVRRL